MANPVSEPPMNLEAAAQLRFKRELHYMFPAVYFGIKWENLDDKLRAITDESAKSLVTRHSKGIFFMGSVGCGKTTALRIITERYFKYRIQEILKEADKNRDKFSFDSNGYIYINPTEIAADYRMMEIDSGIKFITHAQLIRQLRKEMESGDDNPRYYDKRIMMIDDLGRAYEDKSGWNLSLQEEFFNHRWENQLPTFVTTNYTPEDLRKWEGWQRIIDRLGDDNWMTGYTIAGGSKRGR